MPPGIPRALLLICALFFAAAYFSVSFPDAPGASVGSYVSTFLIALPSLVALFRYLGAWRATVSLVVVAAYAYAIETVGVATGLPYGVFYYRDYMGAKFAGLVPYVLPVAYVPLVIGAVAASTASRPWLRVLEAAALLALMDTVLDPGAVSLGLWSWPEGGPYYGVPLSNYLGWLLSGTLASALLLAAGGWWRSPVVPGLLDSAIVAVAFWTGVAIFSGLAVPALLGAGLLAYLMLRRSGLSCKTQRAARV